MLAFYKPWHKRNTILLFITYFLFFLKINQFANILCISYPPKQSLLNQPQLLLISVPYPVNIVSTSDIGPKSRIILTLHILLAMKNETACGNKLWYPLCWLFWNLVWEEYEQHDTRNLLVISYVKNEGFERVTDTKLSTKILTNSLNASAYYFLEELGMAIIISAVI